MRNKRLFGVILVLVCLVFNSFSVYASNENSVINKAKNASSYAIVKDSVTGKEKKIKLKPVKVKKVKKIASNNLEEQVEVTYEAEFPADVASLPKTRQATSFEEDNNFVTARVTVTYTINSIGDKIKVTKLAGGWTINNSLAYLSNRECGVAAGGIDRKALSKKPTSNSFSYDTGWGYVDRINGASGSYAWSEARMHISGMSGSAYQTLSLYHEFDIY